MKPFSPRIVISPVGNLYISWLEDKQKHYDLYYQNSLILKDPSLRVELVASGLHAPITSIGFLGKNDILVLEKDVGTVRRIVNGNLLNKSLLDVNVLNDTERGMLGIGCR